MSREEVLARTVFTVDGDAYTWADVLAAAEAWGDVAPPTADADGEVEERATAFRRRRGLLSVDDTASWFARWGITVPEWLASLRGAPDPWVGNVTSGALERAAHRVAAGVAAHRALGETGRPDPAAIDVARERFACRAATPDRIAAAVAANRLEWTALDLRFEHGDELRITLADAGPALAPLLVGAAAGDVVGPVTVDGRLQTFSVQARIEPDAGDPHVAQRAHAEVAATAVTREVAARVRWLEHVDEPAPADDDVPDDEDAGDFARPPRRIRRFPTVLGVDETDCGAACLTAVCGHFGRAVSLPTVRDAVATAGDGTSLAGLATGAQRVGLAARAVKASPSRLGALPLPAICHWRGNHWVVLYDVDDRSARVMDPLTGPRRLPRAEWDEHWSGFACLVAPTPALANIAEGQPPWRWLLPFFRPHRRPFAAGVALGLAAAGLEMLIPLAAGRIVDGAIAEGDRSQLHLLALGMLAVLLAAVTAGLVQRWLLARVAVRFDAATLDHITGRLLALPATYFGSRRTGDIERRVASMRQIRIYLVQQGVVGLTAAAQVFAAVAIMVVLSPPLAATYLATVPLYAAAMTYSRRRLRPVLASLEESFGAYHSRQIDAIRGIDTVKARGAEHALQTVMKRQFDALADRVYRSDLAFMRYDAAVSLVTFLTLALVLWAGGLFVLGGDLSIGELVAFNGLVVLANGPVGTLMRLWDDVQYASVLLGRLDDVLAQEPEQGEDHSHLEPVPALSGRVSIQHLTVRTGGPVPATILDDVSIDVEPGQTIALVGRSGAGKTTLVRCLAGLQPITSGRILYDGVDLDALDHRELRRRIGFVLQDDHLFDGTLAANIILGDEEVDMERVRWAARVADAAGFIERLPLGYDTRIGETGLRLSGGQAQRVAIARAVYRRPSILILDEATSSLDAESERAVRQGIDELLHGRTAFVIAHRLSTVREADRIVVLDGGRVVEQGTHDELMARRSLYWYLAGQQLDA